MDSMVHCAMCRLSSPHQRRKEKNLSSSWHGCTQTFQNTHLDWALLSLWERFPEPSQGERHLVEIETQIREPNFVKLEEENPRDGEGCWAGR